MYFIFPKSKVHKKYCNSNNRNNNDCELWLCNDQMKMIKTLRESEYQFATWWGPAWFCITSWLAFSLEAWLSWCFCVSSVSFSKLHPEHPSCSSPKYCDGFKIINYDDRDNNPGTDHTETPFFTKVVLFCANDDQFPPHRARRCCCPCQCRHPAVRSGLLRWLKSPSLACALTWLAFRNCGSCDSIYDNDENLWPVLGSKHCEERGEEKKSVEETKHDGQHKNL